MSKMYWQANPANKSVFELFSSKEVAAKFAFLDKNHGIGKIFDAASGKEHFRLFKMVENSLSDTMEVFNAESKFKIASIDIGLTRNGEITFADKKIYAWTHPSWTSFDRVWQTEAGEDVLTFAFDNKRIAENFVAVKFSENAKEIAQISLLLLLGWALLLREKVVDGTKLFAEGNPQEFLAEDKINEVFGANLTAKSFAAPAVLAGGVIASESSDGSLIDAEDVAEVGVDVGIDVGLDLLDWFLN